MNFVDLSNLDCSFDQFVSRWTSSSWTQQLCPFHKTFLLRNHQTFMRFDSLNLATGDIPKWLAIVKMLMLSDRLSIVRCAVMKKSPDETSQYPQSRMPPSIASHPLPFTKTATSRTSSNDLTHFLIEFPPIKQSKWNQFYCRHEIHNFIWKTLSEWLLIESQIVYGCE